MPNQVTSHNERTVIKVLQALTENDAMTMQEALDAINRVMNAGILFREPAEKDEKSKNGKSEE